MRFIHRAIEKQLLKAFRNFPALILTGPRRAGKTTLLQKLFPRASYHLLEDTDLIARVRADPRGFLGAMKTPAILDEIQNVPEMFNYLRTRIDQSSRRMGQWLLTGSQDAPLMRGVSESMAGRVAVFQLLPLSLEENPAVSMLHGGFPEALQRPSTARIWFRSYVQTYLERDVRAISSIRDLSTFRRFLSLLASRCGQILNKTDLASPLGLSVPAITQWLSILETTAQILLVPPFYENFGKRLVKSPKLYFADSGLACHLLGVETQRMLSLSPFRGPIFEGFVASEIVKHQINAGCRKELYYFRDQQGLEVDFVVPLGNRRLALLEARASATVTPSLAVSLNRLARAVSKRYAVEKKVVHLPLREGDPAASVLSPGVRAVGVKEIFI
ncbi:MAG: ATP-binding protein [Candidatus Omnitrophica bacterium]|nr:ATP-binding protein [Candidatus Omnitrophota bacterium]